MDKNKKMIWWVVAAIVVVVLIVWTVMMNNKKNDTTADNTTGQSQTAADGTPDTTTPPATGQSASNLSYNDALKKYGTNRIQIQNNCQTVPNNVTYKSGTAVMFDNRSTAAHTINFNGTTHTIGAQGFTVITMTAAKYPTTVVMDCDKSQNVATVLIQK